MGIVRFLVCLLSYVTVTQAFNESISYDQRDLLVRKARWLPLIYPRSYPAKFKFIVGFGIPVENLDIYEAMTTGYVFKAHYFLPTTAKQLRTKNIHGITDRQFEDNTTTVFQQIIEKSDEELGVTSRRKLEETAEPWNGYRWAVYQSFESLARRMKLNGMQCVLKSICESAAAPFDDRNGLLGELMHILLTPSSSTDALAEHTDNDYLQAERLGHADADCNMVYPKCAKSLLAHFSDVHHIGSEFLKMFR